MCSVGHLQYFCVLTLRSSKPAQSVHQEETSKIQEYRPQHSHSFITATVLINVVLQQLFSFFIYKTGFLGYNPFYVKMGSQYSSPSRA